MHSVASSSSKAETERGKKQGIFRVLERTGRETSQLALARCVMRGVLGRDRALEGKNR